MTDETTIYACSHCYRDDGKIVATERVDHGEGAWSFVCPNCGKTCGTGWDGGELDIGFIRPPDSENDFALFIETFEQTELTGDLKVVRE